MPQVLPCERDSSWFTARLSTPKVRVRKSYQVHGFLATKPHDRIHVRLCFTNGQEPAQMSLPARHSVCSPLWTDRLILHLPSRERAVLPCWNTGGGIWFEFSRDVATRVWTIGGLVYGEEVLGVS